MKPLLAVATIALTLAAVAPARALDGSCLTIGMLDTQDRVIALRTRTNPSSRLFFEDRAARAPNCSMFVLGRGMALARDALLENDAAKKAALKTRARADLLQAVVLESTWTRFDADIAETALFADDLANGDIRPAAAAWRDGPEWRKTAATESLTHLLMAKLDESNMANAYRPLRDTMGAMQDAIYKAGGATVVPGDELLYAAACEADTQKRDAMPDFLYSYLKPSNAAACDARSRY